MSNENNTIVWQKWFDPFGLDDNDSVSQDNTEEDFDNYKDDDSEEFDQTESPKVNTNKLSQKIKVMSTPMGIIPINDNTASSKIFNFWMGHTNFNITPHIAAVIEQTDGVETLDIFTRYRFRIGVGKAFEDSLVMRDINRRVYLELIDVQ